jgi:sugar phosphate isomerase/epimerase
MRNKITQTDYNADWAYKEHYQHPRSKPGYLTPEEFVNFCATLEIDGIELTDAYWGHKDASYARKVAADAGLPVVCYVFVADLTAPPESRQAALDAAYSRIDQAAGVGAPIAMIVPGFVKDGFPLQEQRKWMVEGLRICAEHAQAAGVKLLIENLDYPPARPLTGSSAQCSEICKDVNSPNFGRIYDCGATVFVDEDPLQALEVAAPFLTHVHLKNSRPLRSGENPDRYLDTNSGVRRTHAVMEEGTLDIAAILRGLRKLNYNGHLLIEYQGEDDPRETAKRNVKYLRRLMAEIE